MNAENSLHIKNNRDKHQKFNKNTKICTRLDRNARSVRNVVMKALFNLPRIITTHTCLSNVKVFRNYFTCSRQRLD